jgi:hypothetical protein
MSKKPSAKSKASNGARKSPGKRAMKDLSPRNAKHVKGGLSLSYGEVKVVYKPQDSAGR